MHSFKRGMKVCHFRKKCSSPTMYPIPPNGYSRLWIRGDFCLYHSPWLVHREYIKEMVTLINPETPLDFYLEKISFRSQSHSQAILFDRGGRDGGRVELHSNSRLFAFTDKRINFTYPSYCCGCFNIINSCCRKMFYSL